ncbi:MAG: type III pantothenate kinase [Deltaproteobacteria bacterium]|nr:type III pantothenate kinase [Deltaproteobacteria bacterium]
MTGPREGARDLLVVDVGNTHTVLGVYRDKELLGHWRLASEVHRTPDEIGVLVRNLFEIAGVRLPEIQGVAISSVVPALTPAFVEVSRQYFHREPLVVGPGIRTGMPIHYEDPREVGADRIVNAVAGYDKYHAALIIVDFGTATTFDYVSLEGAYQGGMIAPGLGISMEALFDRASKLPKVGLARPPRVLGRNTVHSMQSGILYGYAALVDGLIDRLAAEVGGRPVVLATGGLAPLLAPEAHRIEHVEEFLTLEGLRILFERNA